MLRNGYVRERRLQWHGRCRGSNETLRRPTTLGARTWAEAGCDDARGFPVCPDLGAAFTVPLTPTGWSSSAKTTRCSPLLLTAVVGRRVEHVVHTSVDTQKEGTASQSMVQERTGRQGKTLSVPDETRTALCALHPKLPLISIRIQVTYAAENMLTDTAEFFSAPPQCALREPVSFLRVFSLLF